MREGTWSRRNASRSDTVDDRTMESWRFTVKSATEGTGAAGGGAASDGRAGSEARAVPTGKAGVELSPLGTAHSEKATLMVDGVGADGTGLRREGRKRVSALVTPSSKYRIVRVDTT